MVLKLGHSDSTSDIPWTFRNTVLKMEISWADRVKEGRNTAHAIKREANWIGHILRRNCLLKHITEGKTRKKT